MKSRALRIAILGLSGQATVHRQAVQWLERSGLAKLSGLVVSEDEQRQYRETISSLSQSGVEIYAGFEDFLQHPACDIVTLATGIHQHVPMSIAALQAGLHVYCEKPTAATVQDVDRLTQVLNQTGQRLVIGFQHISSPSIRLIKRRICGGKLGDIRSIRVLHSWPRSEAYYLRNDWCGRLQKSGLWILDSPANNAMAHYLLNALYLASPEPNRCASPKTVCAELYRANKIESCDLVQVQFTTDTGVTCFAHFAHCLHDEFGPLMIIECEQGSVRWESDEGKAVITYSDGSHEPFHNKSEDNWRFNPFLDLLQAIPDNKETICTPAFTRPHTLCINAMHESSPEIAAIPEEFVVSVRQKERVPPYQVQISRYIREIGAGFKTAFNNNLFLSELNLPWAHGLSVPFTIDNYARFPQNLFLKRKQEAA